MRRAAGESARRRFARIDLWRRLCIRAATAALCACAAGCAVAAGAANNQLQLPEGFPLWQPSADLRVGLGYDDNVTLSSFAPVGSAFETTGAEAMLFRLPWNNWQLTAFATGTDTRYFNRDTGVNTEQDAAASAQFTWWLGKGWKSLSSLQYVFINQVLDVSDTYGIAARQEVYGHGLTAKQGARKEFGPYWLQLDASLARFYFRQPLDNYWQPGATLALGRYYGHNSEVSLSYQAMPLLYDTRQQTQPSGTPIPNTHLRFLPQTFELSWIHYWDDKRLWRNLTRLEFEFNRDNGSGYYDYQQYRLVEQVRFRSARWEASFVGSAAWYHAPHQPLSIAGIWERNRTSLRAGLRVSRTLFSHCKAYAAYDYERSFSNLAAERYQANTGTAGLELFF